MASKVVGLTVFKDRDEPGAELVEMNLLEGLGIEGDLHQGGERQVTLLSAETRRWVEEQAERGLCFARFKENILVEGLSMDDIKLGDLLTVGSAVLKMSMMKPCFPECTRASKDMPCQLSGRAVFAVVEQSGTVRVGDEVNKK